MVFEVYLGSYRQENRQTVTNVEIDGEDVVLSCQQPCRGMSLWCMQAQTHLLRNIREEKTDCRDMEICVTVIRIRLFLTI